MSVQPIPPGYHTVTPYLMVKQGQKLIEFLSAAFGANVDHQTRTPDGLIMHASLRIGDSMLMLSDARGPWREQQISIYLYVPDVDAVYNRAITAGAESINAPRDEFYGDRMAGVKDFCGNTWWIGTHIEDMSEEDLHDRAQKRTTPN